jgi:hypothetical protein
MSGDALRTAGRWPRHVNVTDRLLGAEMTKLRDPIPLIGPISLANPFLGFDMESAKLRDDAHPEVSTAASISATTMPGGDLRSENGVIFKFHSSVIC